MRCWTQYPAGRSYLGQLLFCPLPALEPPLRQKFHSRYLHSRAGLRPLASRPFLDLTPLQIYDIEIDRINKPYLPLAAGDFGVRTGIAIVVATGAAALAIGTWTGSAPLLATLGGSLLLGIAYSTDLPLLRWKRWPLLAAGCILAVRCAGQGHVVAPRDLVRC